MTKAFFGALDEMVTSWILGGSDYDLRELAAPVVDLLLNGAAAPRRAGARTALAPVARAARGEARYGFDALRHLLLVGRHLPQARAPEVQGGRPVAGLSSDEFRRGVEELSMGLRALGVEKGDRVAILSENRPEWALADLATLCRGGGRRAHLLHPHRRPRCSTS